MAGQEIVLGIQSRLLTAIKTHCVKTEVTFKILGICEPFLCTALVKTSLEISYICELESGSANLNLSWYLLKCFALS